VPRRSADSTDSEGSADNTISTDSADSKILPVFILACSNVKRCGWDKFV
jgi:hypothetical protein